MSKPLERTSEAVDHDVEHILELQGSRRAARRDASSEVEAGVDDLNFLQNFLLHCLIDNVRGAVCSRLSQDGLDAVYDTVKAAQSKSREQRSIKIACLVGFKACNA